MIFNYLFSIIMAAYNTQDYLEKAIQSVIKQSVGFSNIQLIIVNDGSTDNTGQIITKYTSRYPNNIVSLTIEKSGVSRARNEGLKLVEGKYINFLDSDDILKNDALKKVYKFFENHYQETDIVSIPMFNFEEIKGPHFLNNKFEKGTRVISLIDEWDIVQSSSSSAFFKKESLTGECFDENLSYFEDGKFVVSLLRFKKTLGVVSNTAYLYRKRPLSNRSALDNSQNSYEWYFPVLKFGYESLIQLYKHHDGFVPKFVQYAILYDLQWKITDRQNLLGLMSFEEKKDLIRKIENILSRIDSDVVIAHKFILPSVKFSILKYKNETIKVKETNDDIVFSSNDGIFYSVTEDSEMVLETIYKGEKGLVIEGRFYSLPLIDGYEVFVQYGGKSLSSKMVLCGSKGNLVNDYHENIYRFVCNISAEECEIHFYIKYKDNLLVPSKIRFGKFFPLSDKYEKSYSIIDSIILKSKNYNLELIKNSFLKRLRYEFIFLLDLLHDDSIRKDEHLAAKKACIIRPIVLINKSFKKKRIWIFRDRVNIADDNGFLFFKYVNQNCAPADCYFAISKSSKDNVKIRQIGKVIDCCSWKYRILFLISDFLISSSADDDAVNPFYGHSEPYKNLLYGLKFVFLQHGITKDDVSEWLNKYNMNIFGFITSSKKEKESILSHYFYDDKNIWLTGMPRYDYLKDKKEKIIAITPTWRQYLLGDKDYDDKRELCENYIKSQYYQVYNELINNQKLNMEANNYGYKIIFCSHPNLKPFSYLFDNKYNYEIDDPDLSYNELFSRASILITDYSSVAFDFAYLKKPVIYFQFDKKEFFANHLYREGYYSYEKNGFGKVVINIDDLVNEIIDILKKGCHMEKQFETRVDEFFEFSDHNNCKRILEKIQDNT